MNSSSIIDANSKPKYRLVEPYRNIGKVVDSCKPFFYKRGHQRLLVASSAYSFSVYNLEKLKIERLSPTFSNPISAYAAFKDKVYVAIKNRIFLFSKLHIIKDFELEHEVTQLIIYERHLLVIDSAGSLSIFEVHTGSKLKNLKLNIKLALHPTAYLNKIVIVPQALTSLESLSRYSEMNEDTLSTIMKSHNLILYNINTNQSIYSELILPNSTDIDDEITVLEQSPVIDVIALGYSKGSILCINLKTFKTVKKLKGKGSISSLSFSDCDTLKTPLLISIEAGGITNIWGLDKSALLFTFPENMFGSCTPSQVMFIPNEPLLIITSEEGNFMKMFIFNEETSFSCPKLLKERTGFVNTPSKLRFYGDDERHIVALSSSQLRVVSTINEHISKDFSTKTLHKSNVNINFVDFDINQFRERDWSNVLVINNQSAVYNSSGSFNLFFNKRLPLFFSSENASMNSNSEIEKRLIDGLSGFNQNNDLTAVCISFCGHFGIAGFSNGLIVKFNMQSGSVRKIAQNSLKSHSAVNSMKCDGLNSVVVSISIDSSISWWDFFTLDRLHHFVLPSTPILLELDRSKDLVAVSLVSCKVIIFSKSNFKKVRELDVLKAHQAFQSMNNNSLVINDMCFGDNGNWLILITNSKTLLIYDIKTSDLVEFVVFEKMPVSVTMSENGVFIALSFADQNYIQLLLNREKYVENINTSSSSIQNLLEGKSKVSTQINPIFINSNGFFMSEIKFLGGRSCHTEGTRTAESEKQSALTKTEIKTLNQNIQSLKQSSNLIEFSSQNKSKYRLIVHYDFISKITAPSVRAKEKSPSPFFLYNINEELSSQPIGGQAKSIKQNFLDTTQYKNDTKAENGSNGFLATNNLFKLNTMLSSSASSGSITIYLNSLSPEILDIEIRNLSPVFNMNNNQFINLFITDYLLPEIKSKKNFELIQSYLNRLLKVFGESILEDTTLTEKSKDALSLVKDEIKANINDLDYLFKSCLNLVSTLGSIQIS